VAPGERVAIALGPEPIGLPFGLGRHACPGARIAVEESDTALRALADVLAPGCTLGEIHHKPHPVFHGLHHAFLTPHRTGRL
jgi:cytochrome P450